MNQTCIRNFYGATQKWWCLADIKEGGEWLVTSNSQHHLLVTTSDHHLFRVWGFYIVTQIFSSPEIFAVHSRWRSLGPSSGDGDSVVSWSLGRADVRVTLLQLSRPELWVSTGWGVTPWRWCSTLCLYKSSGSGQLTTLTVDTYPDHKEDVKCFSWQGWCLCWGPS